MVPVSNSWKVCLQDCISGVAVLCPRSLPEPDRLDGIVNSPAAIAAQVWSLALLFTQKSHQPLKLPNINDDERVQIINSLANQ